MTHAELIKNYKDTTAADAYILGFAIRGWVYQLVMKELPDWMFKYDRESTSHGGKVKERFRPNTDEKLTMIHRLGAEKIGTVEEVLTATGRKNKGEAWEKYQTEKAGQEWKKDSVAYYLDGDLTVNGVKYQIKFESASFANEDTILNGMNYKAAR